ncbi:MAG TPA: LysR family transcriptional regulator [Marmoricola sp.]|nr:LysR family transcriptional regulator [Marmoricola sp.]
MLVRDLQWLLTVAEHQHVTTAAAVLGTTQPTLSRALARLEAEVGTPVFTRAPDGVHLTPLGELVVDAARDISDRHDQLLSDLAGALDPDSGVVRLAFLDSMATSLVPRVLRAFHQHSPRVRVVLSQEPAHEILDDLAAGTVDLAITSTRPVADHGWHRLQEERLVLVVPPRHPLAARRRVRLAQLADEDLITTPVGFGYRSLVMGLFRDAGVVPRVSFESQDLATIEGLVAAGLGVAILPEPFAGLSGTRGVPITGPAARRTIGLVWRSDRALPPPADRFRAFVVAAPGVVAR